MRKHITTITISGISAFVAGFCYEQGRKMGTSVDAISPAKVAAGLGLEINKLLGKVRGNQDNGEGDALRGFSHSDRI